MSYNNKHALYSSDNSSDMSLFNVNDCFDMEWDLLSQEETDLNLLNTNSTTIRRPLQSVNSNIMQNKENNHTYSVTKLAKRNERERNRVEKVNQKFNQLRQILNNSNIKHFMDVDENKENRRSTTATNRLKHKATNLSKVKTLRAAIDYIQYLKSLVEYSDDSLFDCNIQQINF